MTGHCPHCDYDLTGLDKFGSCPECGNDFTPSSAIQPGTFLMRYGKAVILAIVAAVLFVIGCGITLAVDDKVGALLFTLVLAGLPAFGAFVYWFSERQDERERGG